jgi:hypothetical protein
MTTIRTRGKQGCAALPRSRQTLGLHVSPSLACQQVHVYWLLPMRFSSLSSPYSSRDSENIHTNVTAWKLPAGLASKWTARKSQRINLASNPDVPNTAMRI